MLKSTQTETTTRSSSHLASIFDNDYLELVYKNGQVIVQGGSSRTTQQKTNPSSIGYSKEAKSAQIRTLHSHQSISEDQNSCQVDLVYSKSKSNNCSKEAKRTCLSSKKQYLPNSSALFKKPKIIMDSSQTPASSNSPSIQSLGKVINLSNTLRPSPVLIAKSTNYNVKSETLPTKVANEAAAAGTAISSKATDDSTMIQRKIPLISDISNSEDFVVRNKESIPCKQPEAVGSNSSALRAKRKAHTTKFCNEALVEYSSVCSLGASNNPDTCTRKQAETDGSIFLSDNDEEAEDVVKGKDAREGIRVKRRRNAEIHNLSERKRRDKINKKMRVLKELIPNCNKDDKASMLDDAIEYLTTLKLQLQIMSMGARLCMPLMMLPTAPHHMINTSAHFTRLMGPTMCFMPGNTAIPPCNLPHRFSIPPLPAAGGITDINRVHMFGFPNNQMLPNNMPIMSNAPFTPMVGNPSTQPLQATCNATTSLPENLASAQLASLKGSQLPATHFDDRLKVQ